MPLPVDLRALLRDPRLRLAVACAVAFVWYVLAVAGEAGRSPVVEAIVGVPAVLALLWWRARPWTALALSGVTLLLIVFFAAIRPGDPGTGLLALAATSWFSIAGASASDDRRHRWAAIALAVGDVLVGMVFWFGGSWTFGFVFVAFMTAVAIAVGRGYRLLAESGALRTRLAVTASRADTAERDARLEIERNRIAREVHDVVAHSLAVVIAQADGARFAAEANPATVGPALEAIGDTARRALGEVRTMLHDLKASGPGGTAPGAQDIAALADGVQELGVQVQRATFGDERPLEPEQGLALYRIAQEALTNAMRHGDRAEPVGLTLDWGERQVVLVVTNSVPADQDAATERAGHGIEGMRERAAEAGGDCTAGVGSNGVFRVRVALPVALPVEEAATEEPAPNPLVALFGEQPADRSA